MIALLQMLWDRGEADGYAQHLTSDPLPNTPGAEEQIPRLPGQFNFDWCTRP